MGIGIYTAPERVVRDGLLVCFAGEKMTMAEAQRRGLLEAEGRAPEPEEAAEGGSRAVEDRARELAESHKADELRAMAEELGAECPKDANKSVLAAAIAAAEAAAE